MRSPDRYQDSLTMRLGRLTLSWLVWIIPAGKDALTEEPNWVWNTHEVVAAVIFGLGAPCTFVVPMLMYVYNIGTVPTRFVAGIGVYLAFGAVYLLHDTYAHYRR